LKSIFKKEKVSVDNLDKLFTYGFFGILIGARLGHCLFYEPEYYLSRPWEMILPIDFPEEGGISFTGYQGLASHGGILGLAIALYLYSRKTKHPAIDTIDLISVVAGVGLGFIRLGNFMNSEIIGLPTTQAWGVIFEQVDDIPRHPAQLYEAFSYFLIFGIMMTLYSKMRDKLRYGALFGIATLLICIARFSIEFVKENHVDFEDGLPFNMGQLLSIPYIIFAVIFIVYGLRKTKRMAENCSESTPTN